MKINNMDYEEKYKEALDRARKLYDKWIDEDGKDVAFMIFPELAEDKDEKIRKALIEMVHDTTGDSLWIDYNVHKEDALAWLEAKGEPTDKVEPKFKVGDWVVYEYGEETSTLQIARIVEKTYVFSDESTLNVVDEDSLRLWDITKDAKDGDVLFTSSTASHETFIFKSIDGEGNAKCYFAYDSEDGFREGKYHFIGSATNCKPATKEQRDLLFSKMKEAGYEWDAELKRLKKIE